MLSRLKMAGLKLGTNKCHLLRASVTFLGHVISSRGCLPNPYNVSNLLRFPTPITPKQVKQVLGTGSYYRRFITAYLDRIRPLIDLTKKGKTLSWTKSCEAAF